MVKTTAIQFVGLFFTIITWSISFFLIYAFLNKKRILYIPSYDYPLGVSYTLLARAIIALLSSGIFAFSFYFISQVM